jgi:hypothetical protein
LTKKLALFLKSANALLFFENIPDILVKDQFRENSEETNHHDRIDHHSKRRIQHSTHHKEGQEKINNRQDNYANIKR